MISNKQTDEYMKKTLFGCTICGVHMKKKCFSHNQWKRKRTARGGKCKVCIVKDDDFSLVTRVSAGRIQRWWRIALLLDSQRGFRWNGTLKCRLKEELKRRQALRRIALPPGWQLRPSRSCPGLFVYFNVFTKKRIFQDTMATPTRPAAIGVYSHLAALWEDDWIFHTLVQPACRRIQRQWRRSGVREKVDHIGSRLEN